MNKNKCVGDNDNSNGSRGNNKNGWRTRNNVEVKGKKKVEDEPKGRNSRAEASAKTGEERAKGRTKGPGLDREEALVVGKTLAETCDCDALMRTLEELGGRWIEGGTQKKHRWACPFFNGLRSLGRFHNNPIGFRGKLE